MKARIAAGGAILLVLVSISVIVRPESANPPLPISDSGSRISENPQSAIRNSQSAIRNPHLSVSPQGPFTTIQSALDAARAGDEITVERAIYRGAIQVNKPVKLVGVDYPVIDGEGKGIVVTLNAAGAELRGFEVRGSGMEYDNDHAGIKITAPRVVVENNRLRDVLFGVLVFKADDSIVRGNDISGRSELDLGAKGDAIRVWYSPRAQIVGNHVHGSRDVVLWYSEGLVVRENVVARGRYGLHLMFCNGTVIERNRVLDNSVGIYSMFSHNIVVRENLIRGQRGPSGYALGFKDTDNLDAANNVLVDNRGGIYLDGTPFSPQGASRFGENVIAFNDVGVIVLPAVRGNVFENNSFWENVEQVSVQGGGLLGANTWRDNYWSDYQGFDANGDGIGDVPYRAERFFESMMDREPYLRALLYSPATQAIEFAATSFPIVKPQPKFVDPTPRVQPIALADFSAPAPRDAGGLAVGALGLLAVGVVCEALAFVKGGGK